MCNASQCMSSKEVPSVSYSRIARYNVLNHGFQRATLIPVFPLSRSIFLSCLFFPALIQSRKSRYIVLLSDSDCLHSSKRYHILHMARTRKVAGTVIAQYIQKLALITGELVQLKSGIEKKAYEY
jgi:hypothetical protein